MVGKNQPRIGDQPGLHEEGKKVQETAQNWGEGPAGRMVRVHLEATLVVLCLSHPKPPGTTEGTSQPEGLQKHPMGGSTGSEEQGASQETQAADPKP